MFRRVLCLLSIGALALSACSTGVDDDETARPWPGPQDTRPVVDLAFTVSQGLDRASGVENVTFAPDRQTCELVFRAWPNGPSTTGGGNTLTVRSVTSGGRTLPLTVESAGAGRRAPGTLVRARLPRCVPAGESVSAQVAFDLTLADDNDGRLGRSSSPRAAWLGTAFPLLAWVDGEGWATDAAVPVVGETATSETFRLRRLDVTAPSGDAVTGAGELQGTRPGAAAGTTLHRFAADAVRDVTVTVGDLDLTEFDIDGTKVTLAVPKGVDADTAAWRRQLTESVRSLRDLLGPVPYPHLWISVLPNVSEGVEYPGAVQFGAVDPERESWLVTHELAHQWFYGLVGNNQARDPWLDEAFATYAQEVVQPTSLSKDPEEWLGLDGAVGWSMAQFAAREDPNRAYVATVYRQGGRTLVQAREADGDPEAFDAAVRAYLSDEAYQVARPDDLAEHLSDLPGATRVLREAGALR